MEFEVPNRYILMPTLSIHMVQTGFTAGKAKEVL